MTSLPLLKPTYLGNKSKLRCSLGVVVVLITSGCVGSEQSTSTGGLSSADALIRDGLTLSAQIQGQPYSNLEDLPTSGSLDFDGYLLARLSDRTDNITDTLAADLSVNVDFDAVDLVTGESTRVYDASGAEMQGVLQLSGGMLDYSGDPNIDATFEFDGNGELVDTNGTMISLDFLFEGDFYGTSNNAIAGGVFGQAEAEGVTQQMGGQIVLILDQ